ncbi:MAG: site-specific integrase [Gammaproteobacteria bacterium]|nr:site-specific integrase [Gammaproteobacteria bacterium]
MRRTHGTASLQKAPLMADQLKALVDGLDLATAAGVRDRALLLVGFAAALRRSELAALAWEDIEWVPQGMRLHIRRSKTDQEGSGSVVAVPHGGDYCPVVALRAWRGFLGVDAGPVFRGLYRGGTPRPTGLSCYAIALVVQRHASRLGWETEQYAAHSLRSGWATSAALNGASLAKMREVTRHKSLQTLQIYIRRAEEFTNHAGEGLL